MSVFRRPKTRNEMRASADPEIRDLVRPARQAHSLPTEWDDRQPAGARKRNRGKKPRYKDHRRG